MKLLPLPLRFVVLPVLACCTSAIKALTYSYDGNRIIRIQDDADPVILESSSDFAGDRSDYTYDADGALYSDSARGIGTVVYAPTGQPLAISEARMLFNDRALFNRSDPKAGDYPLISKYPYVSMSYYGNRQASRTGRLSD